MATTVKDPDALPEWADEELLAAHESAHCLMLWKLRLGIREVTIERRGKNWGFTTAARSYDLAAARNRASRRYMIEQQAMHLLAGSVAERLLRPDCEGTAAVADHERLHREMSLVADSGSIQFAWCDYLWQRAYEYLAWPGRWKPLIAFAGLLRKHRTIDGRSAEVYLARATDFIKRSAGAMPDFTLVGEVTYASSPWHRVWHRTNEKTPARAMKTDLPAGIEALEAEIDLRPIEIALPGLSGRALKCLELVHIRRAGDLTGWSARALASIKGAGQKTVREIAEAAARAGIRLPPDSAESPWRAYLERRK
jgi:hypothetical protein